MAIDSSPKRLARCRMRNRCTQPDHSRTWAAYSIKRIDSSADFMAYAKVRVASPHLTFEVADEQTLPIDSASFDVAVSGLVLNFVPEPRRALAEMARVTRPGGMVAAYVWDYAEKMELMRHFWNARRDAGSHRLGVRRRPSLSDLPAVLSCRVVQERQLAGGRSAPDRHPHSLSRFRRLLVALPGRQGPAPGYAMSLSEERRGALRERIRSSLPITKDGSIPLMARVWAVRGHAP